MGSLEEGHVVGPQSHCLDLLHLVVHGGLAGSPTHLLGSCVLGCQVSMFWSWWRGLVLVFVQPGDVGGSVAIVVICAHLQVVCVCVWGSSTVSC